MKNILIKHVVTRSIFPSIMMILGVTTLFAAVGFIPLYFEGRLNSENWYSLIINTAKFSMWFFLGYGGIQAFGLRIEIEQLKHLEDAKYLAHARADFEPWTQMNRNMQDEQTLIDIQKIDEQRVRISGDDKTAFWLFNIGVTLFFLISVIELLYPAFK